MTSQWTAAAVARIAGAAVPEAPVIAAGPQRILAGFDLWDLWPVCEIDGRVAEIAGGRLVMLLAAPMLPDPDSRHAIARIRLMHQVGDDWRDLGWLLPDGLAPGSREWAGSAVVDPGHCRLTLFFTAAGQRGETAVGFDQRLFETSADLDGFAVGKWSQPRELVVADGVRYVRDMIGGGAIGTIKAFRDPAWFRDPADGREYVLFAGSLAQSSSRWNGAIGSARRHGGQWKLRPPLIAADGVNNELERPHVIVHDHRYYCFWSTQAKVFADGGPVGPNGLYGMAADHFAGPWRPLNGTGLVLANPAAQPLQAYSWLVLDDLSVISFADLPGLDRPPADTGVARRHFGGTPAPVLQLELDGDRSRLA